MTAKTTFSCGEALDIQNAAGLLQRLQKSMQKSLTIELKADSVVKADTAGLQLFVSLKKELDGLGGDLIWKKPSDDLLKSAELLGLSEKIGLQ